jgi:hypothetical protein
LIIVQPFRALQTPPFAPPGRDSKLHH